MLARILHIILFSIILFSSAGISIHQHYCLDELKSTSLLWEGKTCHEKATEKLCSNTSSKKCCAKKAQKTLATCHNAAKATNGNCCHNESQQLKIESDWTSNILQNQIIKSFQPIVFMQNLAFFLIYPSNTFDFPTVSYQTPLLFSDILLLKQSFLH